MKRSSLIVQVFLAILAVSLAAVLASGLVTRATLSGAFERYLSGGMGPMMGPGRGMGHGMFLGTAEQAFLAGVDRGIIISALVAVALAALGAWLLARYLVQPLRDLTAAARALAEGRLEHRVEEAGPEEAAVLAAAFNEMADSLSESEALRRRMVSDVAHELRNPIAALRAQIEGIADGVLAADDRQVASLVEDVGTLSRLVDDLQELSVAEAGRLRYDRTVVDIRDVVRAEVERARVIAPAGVSVTTRLPDQPVNVYADEFRIGQVVRNLLSNALRHTSQGSVTVIVESPDEGHARVSVSDTGEGIPADDLAHIWERFYRADAARAKDTGGTGLGLAISRRIVVDHGGSVFASSAEGQGSTIGFDIPRTEEPPQTD